MLAFCVRGLFTIIQKELTIRTLKDDQQQQPKTFVSDAPHQQL